MLRQPLEVPWAIHGSCVTTKPYRDLWWLIALLVMLGMFLIGVDVTNGIN